MANPPIPNIYHLRTVAETSSKPCMICFKPTIAVLITPDNKDFFYVCRGHLKDKGFASPIIDAEYEKRKKDSAMQAETDRIVTEYREKIANKEKKEKEKEKDKKDDKKEKDVKEKKKDKDGKEEKKEEEKDAEKDSPAPEEIPRIYALHRNFYKMRLDRLQKAEIAKRNRELLKNPNSFPAVPKDLP